MPGVRISTCGPFWPPDSDELFGVLEIAVAVDRLAEQTAGVERRAVGGRHDADLALRDDCRLGDRDAEQVRMNRPQSRRQRAQLYALDAALFDKGDRVLKVVVRVLRAVGREDSARRHRLAVDRFDHADLVGRRSRSAAPCARRVRTGHLMKCSPGFSTSAWMPTSPSVATTRPGGILRPDVTALLDRDLLRADVDQKSGKQRQ